MRVFTLLLAIGFGMMLSWVMLLNPQPVQVVLESNGLGWIQPAVRTMPLWQVIFWSVAVGMIIGFLLSRGLSADSRRRLREYEYSHADELEEDEPDYVVGLRSRRR